jgi:hypothetical protein
MPPTDGTTTLVRDLFATGKFTAATLAAKLNADGVRCPRDARWRPSTVERIVSRRPRTVAPTRPNGPEVSEGQPTTKTRGKATPVAANGKSVPRDLRSPVPLTDVRSALALASSAASAVFDGDKKHHTPPRFTTPARWGELRQLTHTLSADDRAVAVLRLLLEVGSRASHDGSF